MSWMLGHAGSGFTLRTYIRTKNLMQEKAAATIGGVIGKNLQALQAEQQSKERYRGECGQSCSFGVKYRTGFKLQAVCFAEIPVGGSM